MSSIFHGGRLDAAIAQHGGTRAEWLDLSTGINPNAYPIPELCDTAWQGLPDEKAHSKLTHMARQYYQVPRAFDLVSANGTQALIQVLPFVLGAKKVAVISPTYEEHAYCWDKAGGDVVKVDHLSQAVECAEVVVVVNPNNPTAFRYQPDDLIIAAEQLVKKSGYLIVDEAFADCVPELSVVSKMQENIIVLRSFGKFFGLAGLRLGFAICASSIAESLKNKQGPWSVSGPALEIGAAAFTDQNWIVNSRADIIQNSDSQAEVIEACGLKLIGNAGLFMEFEYENATILYEKLQQEHILIRPFPERPTRLRFGLCKNMQELERLALTLKKMVV